MRPSPVGHRVLLTGFGPFPGVPRNASGPLARALAAAARRRFPAVTFRSATLPTEWAAAPRRLRQLLAGHRPALALHFGVSERAHGFVIETQARNVRAAIYDAAGVVAQSEAVVEGGPEVLRSTFPARSIVERLQEAGLPASLSDDAGSYLCNALLYHSLRYAADAAGPMSSGFIHVPVSLAQDHPAPPSGDCLLDWAGALRGGLEIIALCLSEASAGMAEAAAWKR